MASRGFLVGLGLGIGVGVATSITVVASLKALNDAGKTRAPVVPTTDIQTRRRGSPEQMAAKLDQIRGLEDSFFKGIDKRAKLTVDQIRDLKTFLVAAVGDSVQDLMACQSLEDILHLLRRLDVISSISYRRIPMLLQNSGIGVDVANLAFHVNGLQLAVGDIGPIGYELDMFEMDVLILHTEQDQAAVLTFRQHLMNDVGVNGLTVQTFEEFCGPNKTVFNAMGDVYRRTRYVFVYMTTNMVSDELKRFLAEIVLTESFEDPAYRHRIVPIWATKKPLKVPEMRVFTGLKYWMCLTGQSDEVEEIYRSNAHRMLMEGRETFVRA